MITSVMISNYLQDHDHQKTMTVLKRTRASTRKFIGNHEVELEKSEAKGDVQILIYKLLNKLNKSRHEIKLLTDQEIIDVSCDECSEFCSHRKILLTQIAQKLEQDDLASSSRKRKLSDGLQPKRKRVKLDAENDPNDINTQEESQNIIKLVKKKKKIEIPEDQLASVQVLKMENLIKSFGKGSCEDFKDHCIDVMNGNPQFTEIADKLTVDQADTSIWHELRIGRITASRLHETSRCTMIRGSLVDKFLGKKSGWSFAMMRGTVLEEFVFEEVRKEFPDLKRSGLIMSHNSHPFFAASPDGIHQDFVLEIKCPSTQNTFEQYIDVEKLSRKYFAQIQLQMFVTGKKKALLAVANLDFEKTRKITKVWIPIDVEYLDTTISQAMEFYEKAVFPALKRQFLR